MLTRHLYINRLLPGIFLSPLLPGLFALGCGPVVIRGTSPPPEAPYVKELLRGTLTGHKDTVTVLAFSPDGKKLASGSIDKTVRLWDVTSEQELMCLEGHGSDISAIAFSPDGRLMATGDWDGRIRVWDVSTWRLLYPLEAPGSKATALAFTPDSRSLAAATLAETTGIKIWEVPEGKERAYIKSAKHGVWSMAFAGKSRALVTVGTGNKIRLWDIDTGDETSAVEGYEGYDKMSIQQIAFAPGGAAFATLPKLGRGVKLWDFATLKPKGKIEHDQGTIDEFAFSPDGKLLVTGGGHSMKFPGEMKFWDVETRQLLAMVEPTTHYLYCLTFAPDGSTVATGSYREPIIRLWDVAKIRDKGLK